MTLAETQPKYTGFQPSHLYYLVSFACNERCTKCHHWAIRPVPKPLDPKLIVNAIMSLPSIEEFCIVGGEPLVYLDSVYTILSGIDSHHCRSVLITNGVLLDPGFLDTIADFKLHIVVSIDTVDREMWKFVRGKDTYDRVMDNLRYASKRLQKHQLSIQSVLAKETVSHIQGVRSLCDELGVYHSVQDYISSGFEGEWTPLPSEHRRISDNERCYAAGRNLSIMHNGDVFTCFQQSWINGFGKPLGNLRDDSIDSIIRSDYTNSVQEVMAVCNLPCKVLKCNQK